MARKVRAGRGGEAGAAAKRRGAKRSRRAGPKAAKPSGAGTGTIEQAAVEAALALAERGPWARVTLAEIAAEAGLSLAALMQEFPSKTAILGAFQRGIDRTVLEAGEVGEGSARDRLFELLMRRLEALGPHRKALASIAAASPQDPLGVLCGWSRLVHSMGTTLTLAGLSAEGLPGLIRAKVLAMIYGSVLPSFWRDDSADLSRTMAALDGRLQRIETIVSWCQSRPRPAT
jgi:AcrR family transcriptional regulator